MSSISPELDALFAPWARTDAPGLCVGVAREGAVIYRRGFGMASLEAARALTPQTRLRIGSTTKHMTGLLALLLQEDGKLDLDAPIRTYLPELTGPGGDPSPRLLLQHRGGSRCYLDLSFIGHGFAAPPTGRAFALQVRQQGRNFAPGTAMIYNNGGYHLVSAAIERVGGAPFEAQMKQRLFEPLGMADTESVPSDHVITPGIATMHVPSGDGGWRRGLFPSEEVRGEGGVVSTVDDMLRWTAHLRARNRFGSAETWGQLVALPQMPDGSVGSYALGLMIGTYRGAPILHHAGGVVGGSSQMLTFPEHGLDIVILSNGAAAADPSALALKVADIVLGEHLGEAAQAVPAAAHAALIGEYWSEEDGMVYGLRDVDGQLRLTACGSPPLPLQPADGGAVCAPGSVGDIFVGLAEASDGLPIRFGGRTLRYQRLDPGAVDADAFAGAAAGRYFSADADATMVLQRDGKGLVAVFSDPYGRLEADVAPLGDSVALATLKGGALPFTMALSFVGSGAKREGFLLSTLRTRGLEFRAA